MQHSVIDLKVELYWFQQAYAEKGKIHEIHRPAALLLIAVTVATAAMAQAAPSIPASVNTARCSAADTDTLLDAPAAKASIAKNVLAFPPIHKSTWRAP